MAATDTTTSSIVVEADDRVGVEEVFAEFDLTNLSNTTRDALAEAAAAAMRPLVVREWARHGYTVRWAVEDSRRTEVGDRLRSHGETVADLRELSDTQVEVWGAAYNGLDTAAIYKAVATDAVTAALTEAGKRLATARRGEQDALADIGAWLIAGQEIGLPIAHMATLAGISRPTAYKMIGEGSP